MISSSKSFDGASALVTGAAQGIGEAIARRLATEGARVGLMDVSVTALEAVSESIRSDGGWALPLGGDVTVHADRARALEAMTRSEAGFPALLVNNAGVQIITPFTATPAVGFRPFGGRKPPLRILPDARGGPALDELGNPRRGFERRFDCWKRSVSRSIRLLGDEGGRPRHDGRARS